MADEAKQGQAWWVTIIVALITSGGASLGTYFATKKDDAAPVPAVGASPPDQATQVYAPNPVASYEPDAPAWSAPVSTMSWIDLTPESTLTDKGCRTKVAAALANDGFVETAQSDSAWWFTRDGGYGFIFCTTDSRRVYWVVFGPDGWDSVPLETALQARLGVGLGADMIQYQ